MTTRESARVSVPVVVVGFLLVLVDGFDSATISVVVPQLAADWGLAPSDFTYPIAATNAGVAVGYMIAGSLAARFRTAPTLYAGLLVAALGSALSAVVLVTESMLLLTLTRVVTGLGIGVVLPAAISVTTSLNPAAMKQRISVLVTLGLASGIAVGGLVGKAILTRWGPAGMYWVAAAATIAAAVVAVAVLPRRGEPAARTTDEAASGRMQELLVPAYRSTTLLLWAFSFLVFITAYMLTSWIPTILVSFGFTPTEAPIGLTYLSIGGVQQDGRPDGALELRGDPHVVVVGVGADDRLDRTPAHRPHDRGRVVGGVDDDALVVVTQDPHVVVDLVGLPVQAERARGDGVVDPQTHAGAHRTTTERSTSPPCILSKAASIASSSISSVTNLSRSRRPCW